MAQEHWMKRAFSQHKGAFTAQAQKAGESTQAFAREHLHSGGTIGRRARLAALGAKISRRYNKARKK